MILEELQIELCGVCNATCSYCTWQKRTVGKQMIDTALVKRLLGNASQLGVGLVTFHGVGEPTLHPKLLEVLASAESLGLKTRLSTNCYKLEGELAEGLRQFKSLQLILAVPFTMLEKDPKFFAKCLENARNYVESGWQNRSLHALMVCAEQVEPYAEAFVQAFRPYLERDRFNIHLKQPQTWPNDTPNKGFVRENLKISPKVLLETQATPRSLAADCRMPERLLMVLADGTVVPCCVGMDEWGLGRIQDRALSEVWESPELETIRDKWRRSDDSIPCGHCKKRTDCHQ